MNLQEHIRRVLKEETYSKRDNLLKVIEKNGLYDFMKITGLNYNDVYFKIGELTREVKIQYLKDAVNDLEQIPHELDLTMITGSIPLWQNENDDTVYAEYISNENNVLKIYVYYFTEDGEDEYEAIAEDEIGIKTLDTIVTELSEKLQDERNTRI